MNEQKLLCTKLGLLGRIIIAKEGINGTVDGTKEATDEYMKAMEANPLFTNIKWHWKISTSPKRAFPRLSVKVRDEIVSSYLDKNGNPIDPRQVTGKRLKPEELRTWYEQGKKFVVVDMRNDYEYQVGRFKDSVNPELPHFRDLPKVLPMLQKYKEEKVPILSVCTGGVRCEKASGYLIKNGFEDVYQLDGGMVSYMEKYPGKDFEGSLFVFDQRNTMHFNSPEKHVVVGRCEHCNKETEKFLNCKDNKCGRLFICCTNCGSEDRTVPCKKCK